MAASKDARHSRVGQDAVTPRIWSIWLRRGLVARLLWPVSVFFRTIVFLRQFLYRRGVLRTVRLPVPVIVVGNLLVGGTGKTPFTIWLVEALRAAGYRPGVISRGYGGQRAQVHQVFASSKASDTGDEPVLIARRTGCPLFVGRDRIAAAGALLDAHHEVDVIVSDDGLQHYRLQRDVEVVLSDSRGVGNGWLLPAGPLREPSGRRYDFSVVNLGSSADAVTTDLPPPTSPPGFKGPFIMRLVATSMEKLGDARCRMTLAELASRVPAPSITAAAGIGNPARFFTTLRIAGLDFVPLPLPDHYPFSAGTFADCATELILITEKDAVKCMEIAALTNDPRIWVVPVSAQLAAPLADYIVEKLRGHETA